MSESSVSVICTVFNEADSIERLLASLVNQTTPPAEIIIVDGGSSDGTPDKIVNFAHAVPPAGIKLIVHSGFNISQGRNAAIAAATQPIIASTDAGVRLPPNWLQYLTAPFFADGVRSGVEVVAGFFQTDPDPHSPFEIAMGATVLPAEQDIKPEKFLPSSRSIAFTKEAWQKAGGYPEWLDYCEDLIFDLNLKKQGYSFFWQPKAVAFFKPRQTLRAFFAQYYRYARGDGKADLFLKRHLLRYFIYLVVAPLGLWVARRWPVLILPTLICAEGYVIKAHRRLWLDLAAFKQLSLPQKLLATLYVPLIRAVGDIAKMVGYPVGLWWRFTQKQNTDKDR